MKKLLCICMAVLFAFSAAACNHGKGGSSLQETVSGENLSDNNISAVPPSSSHTADTSSAQQSGSQPTAPPSSSAPSKTSGSASSAKPITDDKELYKTIFNSETAWLASLQYSNGAIPMTPAKNGLVSMNPYFADFAALAMLDAADKYSGQVKKYMEWHFKHLNTATEDYNGVDGTIYDYTLTVDNGVVTAEEITVNSGKKSYDSTDSYAATFLSVLKKYYEKTGDSAYIISRKSDISRVVSAMLSTMQGGLTLAKPDYEVKYLMDNCEVYSGANDAVYIFKNIICPKDPSFNSTLKQVQTAAKQIYDTLERKLWNSKGNYYEAALFSNGQTAYTFSWDSYYPCATAQLFPVSFGVISPNSERAKLLYREFCKSYDWQNFKIPDSFYWGSNVYAAAMMGDSERVSCYMTRYAKIIKKHAYPLYNADAAKVAMAAYIMLKKSI